MRILNVIMCLDPVAGGGSVERVYQLSRYLALAGEGCTILTTRQGWDQAHADALGDVQVVALPYVTERFKVPLGTLRWLRRHGREYDVVHLAMNWTLITALAFLYLRATRRPYVYSAMGWVAIEGRSRLFKRIYRAVFTGPIARGAARCIAITRREAADYRSLGVEPSKIEMIPNGIDADAFVPVPESVFRGRHGIDRRPYILFIGRLNAIKGPDLLIDAFAKVAPRFPDHQLVIAGNNPTGFLAELEGLVSRHGLEERVTFLGPIFGEEKRSAYGGARLFVIPSRFDTMTIVALEAAAAGAPILLTDTCDFPQLQDAGGGLMVDASVEGLAAGLEQLLSDPAALQRSGEKARAYVEREFHWTRICERFQEVFTRSVQSGRSDATRSASQIRSPAVGAGRTRG